MLNTARKLAKEMQDPKNALGTGKRPTIHLCSYSRNILMSHMFSSTQPHYTNFIEHYKNKLLSKGKQRSEQICTLYRMLLSSINQTGVNWFYQTKRNCANVNICPEKASKKQPQITSLESSMKYTTHKV